METDEPANVGTYHISIIGSVPSTFMDPPTYQEELVVVLTVANECTTDEVVPLATITDQLYYIDEDGNVSFVPSWSTSIPGCPVTYEIGRMDEKTGLERPLNVDELAVVTF